MKVNYPDLLTEARKWDKDAYLYFASIPISSNVSRQKIVASFHSLEKADTSIMLTLLPDGSITKNIVSHTVPAMLQQPVLDSDWVLDSGEALEKFLLIDKNIESFLQSHQTHCSDLKLERFLPKDTQPVVWSLSLFDCNFESKYYYLNPITGDLLDLSRSIIPDSILITPSP